MSLSFEPPVFGFCLLHKSDGYGDFPFRDGLWGPDVFMTFLIHQFLIFCLSLA